MTDQRSVVAVIAATRYGDESVEKAREAIRAVGGMAQVVKPGDTVLIKPNLVNAFTAESGNVTHASLVEAAILASDAAGADTIIVGEGSASMETYGAYVTSGMKKSVEALKAQGIPVEFRDLNFDRDPATNQYVTVDLGDAGLNTEPRYKVAHSVLASDVIISVPKMKTHSEAGITVALKNMIGTAPSGYYGYPKRVKRLPHGKNIWRTILDLQRIAVGQYPGSPKTRRYLALVDGVIAGAYTKSIDIGGPEWPFVAVWDPVNIGVIVAGRDPVAVDATSARIMCYNPAKIPTLRHAQDLGFGMMDDFPVVGEPIKAVQQVVLPPLGRSSMIDARIPSLWPKLLYNEVKLNIRSIVDVGKLWVYANLQKLSVS